jgi:DNA repair exonuclease SbcCD nuclease subunit
MIILHLSDFHFRNEVNAIQEQERVTNAILETIKGNQIDFVFFTGDIVNKGDKVEDFEKAAELLLANISKITGIDKTNIFICAGNHDLHRGQELPALQSDFDKMKSNNDLDGFVDIAKNKKSFEESILNIANYNQFAEAFFAEHVSKQNDLFHPLYSVHKRESQGKKIGIATINTAWRSFDSDKDAGNLFYPVGLMKNIINELRDTDFKILLLHHPLSDLKTWNAYDLEDLVYREFHLMFSGHVHKKKKGTIITSDEGIYFTSSPATLDLYDSTSDIGFSVYDFDTENYQIITSDFMYHKNDGVMFTNTHPSIGEIPLQGTKKEQNEFRGKIRSILETELENANELFITSGKGNEENIQFLELFTEPVIKEKSKSELTNSSSMLPKLELNSILDTKENYVLFSKDKGGKTSLLTKLKLDLLFNYSTKKIIPYYFDACTYKNNDQFDIIKEMSKYFMLSYNKTKDLFTKYHIKLLIDNYEPSNHNVNKSIQTLLSTCKNISFVITTRETVKKTYEDLVFDSVSYKTYYLHDISRTEVRALANKWTTIPDERKEVAIDKVMQIFRQLNMPLNYWTVSLFLWIFEKTNEANFHNSFELIQLYIDNLLDKRGMALDRSIKIDFEEFKSYLGYLAHKLITDYNKFDYTITYAELVAETNTYRENNRRFTISIDDLIKLIIDKGILIKLPDERFTFRLNGIFEYFLAIFLGENDEFRENAIKDNSLYLSFKNEFELYAGFNKRDKAFVESIFDKTKELFKSITDKYNGGKSKDAIMQEKIDEVFDLSKPMQQISKSDGFVLSPEQQDDLVTEFENEDHIENEVKPKKVYEEIKPISENLEKALFILCRVFRNSNIKDDGLEDKILDFVLDTACNLGFLIIDETNQENANDLNDGDSHEKTIMKLLSNFMPLIIQTYLFDALAQNNLERIFKNKIDELLKSIEGNQLKLAILYLMLIDLDIKSNKGLIDELVKNIDLGVLEQTTLIKLHTYLMFKAHNQPKLEKVIREKIQEQSLKINSKVDLGDVHKSIERSKKIGLLKGKENN